MRKTKQNGLFSLPAWVPYDAWCGYIEMRLKIRKPMTAYAAQLAINKLWELSQRGNDPQLVLEQSILNSWQGLFPLQVDANGQNSKADRRASKISESTSRIFEQGEDFTGNNATCLQNEISGYGNNVVEGDVKELFLSGNPSGNKRIN